MATKTAPARRIPKPPATSANPRKPMPAKRAAKGAADPSEGVVAAGANAGVVSALSIEQIAEIRSRLGFANNRELAEALGLSHVSLKRIMTSAQGMSKQAAVLLLALLYFRERPQAAAEFDQLLAQYNAALPKVSQ
ncbi:hypothetical protein [Cupriavidus pampae]|uniref:Uncharacterized protein n=1 Tax=Cupriavidus pampae TaxID=659251 RepID=A0ABN7ZGT1_9BURK|nr:hypothetical protein [Cupriavidus pampae]CAG9184403.1 hypothetical protein LMG32289_05607 [Cupriavidus pampae]